MRQTNTNEMLSALGWSIKKYVDLSLSKRAELRKESLDQDMSDPHPKPVREPDNKPPHDPEKSPIKDSRVLHMDY